MLIRKVLTILLFTVGMTAKERVLASCVTRNKEQKDIVSKELGKEERFELFVAHVAPPLKNKAYKDATNKAKMGKKESFYKKYYEVAALEKKDFSYPFLSLPIPSYPFLSLPIPSLCSTARKGEQEKQKTKQQVLKDSFKTCFRASF